MAVSADKWFSGVNYEVGFWQKWLTEKGGPWPDDFRNRVDPDRPFDSVVEDAIRDVGSRTIEILDVGSGPITSLGYVSKKFDVRITAVDPLADAYSVLLKEAGVTPPVKTQQCFGEKLLEYFGDHRFDVCHSSNALDHSMEPRAILLGMAQLLRPGGLFFVRVHPNEGENARYTGLHNWNFDKDENDNFVLWRGSEKHKINVELSDFVEGRTRALLTEFGPEVHFIAYRRKN